MSRLDTMAGDTMFDGLKTTDDYFLGDRLVIRQPDKGYRAGVDAVLLAACVRCGEGPVLDLGAGVGTVGLCAAVRCPDIHLTLVERQAELAALAQGNVSANGLDGRVTVVEADIGEPLLPAAARLLLADGFAHVLANPPYHDDGAGTASANVFKALSHSMAAEDLEIWARFMARMTKPGGRATIIHRVDALPRILKAFENRFGAITIFPVYPRADAPAIRVIVDGIKGSRAPLVLKAGLILHGEGHAFRPDADAILRHGSALTL
jgi:tRNA1(Val) A37 N6-methylase TrmN6